MVEEGNRLLLAGPLGEMTGQQIQVGLFYLAVILQLLGTGIAWGIVVAKLYLLQKQVELLDKRLFDHISQRI